MSCLKGDVSDAVGRISTHVTCAVCAMVPALGTLYFVPTNFSLCSFPLPLHHLHPSLLAATMAKPKSPKPSSKVCLLLETIHEIRFTIWKFALPSNENLILDPEHLSVPGPVLAGDYQAAASLLLVSKQVHNEVLPLLYSRNTVTILRPWDLNAMCIDDLPQTALQSITKVELRLKNSLHNMGRSARIMLSGGLPSIKYLRLNFWHERCWLLPAMELAYRAWRDEEFVFKLELYESVHDLGHASELDDSIINKQYRHALNRASVYDLKIPQTLETITLSASVTARSPYAMAAFKSDEEYPAWRFNRDEKKDTALVKYLVWEGENNLIRV